MKVLVRIPNWVGDIIMATPALRALRAGFPGAEIAVLGRAQHLAFLDGAPWFDRMIPIPVKKDGRHPAGPFRTGRSLRGERFDLAVLLPNSWSSAIAAFWARIPRRAGYRNDLRGVLLTDAPKPPRAGIGRIRAVSMVKYYLGLARERGCPVDEKTGEHLELPDTPAAAERAAAWCRARGIAPEERVIAFNVGAAYGSSKLWVSSYWAAVADHFLEKGDRVVIYGSPGDARIVDEVVLLVKAGRKPLVSTDTPLADLAAHMKRASVLIATDSGGRHFGVAVGTPTVAIVGPMSPVYTEVEGARYTVLREPVECAPCHLRECPIDHRCMTRVRPDAAIAAAEAWLAGRVPFGGKKPWLDGWDGASLLDAGRPM